MERKFTDEAAFEGHAHYEQLTDRVNPIEHRADDIRTPFGRDYTRIIHSRAYRRLKHKTQVFFDVKNDHVCTRMEHVQHVESVSFTIANALGLNTELTKAIATGHDLGHAPFGHEGEKILSKIMADYMGKEDEKLFWHEKNGLYFADCIETLPDSENNPRNLNLTYAVRDGIICHCGELDDACLRPREDFLDLYAIDNPGMCNAVTWEGCVVKISDKIAYLGRDIEDAKSLGFINDDDVQEIINRSRIAQTINTTNIIHSLIMDIVRNSSPEAGIRLSGPYIEFINRIKTFNYEKIYHNPKLEIYRKYSSLIIHSIFDTLLVLYPHVHDVPRLKKELRFYPELKGAFIEWIGKYSTMTESTNRKIYADFENRELYFQAIIDFIAGMTDDYAVRIFNELITYR